MSRPTKGGRVIKPAIQRVTTGNRVSDYIGHALSVAPDPGAIGRSPNVMWRDRRGRRCRRTDQDLPHLGVVFGTHPENVLLLGLVVSRIRAGIRGILVTRHRRLPQ